MLQTLSSANDEEESSEPHLFRVCKNPPYPSIRFYNMFGLLGEVGLRDDQSM
jgi:hypothetical protein